MNAYFVYRIINATIQKMVFEYENKEHFKMALCFHYGNFQLYPETHANESLFSIVIHSFLRLTIYKPH
jgi:hypothetical protein